MLRGGQISRRAAEFSGDGRLLVAPCGNDVRVYAAASGEQVQQLEGHKAEVTCVVVNPADGSQVYSASVDGTVRLWDLNSYECVRTLKVGEAIKHMVIHAKLNQAYMSIDWRNGESGRVISWFLDKGKPATSALKIRGPGPLALNTNGQLIATVDKHSLLVWRVGPEMTKPLNLHHTKPYTCVAISQDDAVIAAGDASGRILIWRDVSSRVPHATKSSMDASQLQNAAHSIPPVCTTVHWHSGPVGCLSFSPDSTYLRSGGREGVLVSWQLEGNDRGFLPRLGGPLIGITHCEAAPNKVLLRQADNTLRVVNLATSQVDVSIFGLKPAVSPTLIDSSPATIIQPKTGLLCAPTTNAVMQLFDTTHNRHISLLQVSPRNDVTATQYDPRAPNGGQDMLSPVVTHAAFTHDGNCLATVHIQPGAGTFSSAETTLKFWDVLPRTRTTQAAPFALNTLADDPHRGAVTCIASHPSMDMIVTAGGGNSFVSNDGSNTTMSSELLSGCQPEFKIWERVPVPRKPGSRLENPTCWRCRLAGSYKGLAFTAAAFSPDGSVLALAVNTVKVTLWEPQSGSLACVLPTPPELMVPGVEGLISDIQTLSFISGTPYLVASNGCGIAVWNLLTAAVAWAAPLHSVSLTVDPVYPRFAIAVPLQVKQPPKPTPKAPAAGQGQQSKQQQATEAGETGKKKKRKDVKETAAQSQGEEKGRDKKSEKEKEKPGSTQADGKSEKEKDKPDSKQADGQKGPSSKPTATQQKGPRRSLRLSHLAFLQQQQLQRERQRELQRQKDIQKHQEKLQAERQAAIAAQPTYAPMMCVLVFDPASPMPLLVSKIHKLTSCQLLFKPNTATHRPDSPAGKVSTLLILTEDRSYAELLPKGHSKTGDVDKDTVAAVPKKDGVSAFEAAFGAFMSQDNAMDIDQQLEGDELPPSRELQLKALFDTPSHILPPPTALASAFLQLLTAQQQS